MVVGAIAMVLAGLVVARVTPFGAITVVAAAIALGGAGLVVVAARGGRGRALGSAALVGVLLAGGLLAWVGANDPTVLWFGHITSHGDRGGDQVALTFDDGPDDPFSLEVARILDDHGVKGTFFEVGKAIDARPDITQALLADGQLLGNHSYHHDYWRWLDPTYPELASTQHSFERAIGKCPAFFRPPHGQRTPFMLARVTGEGMHAVTWDTSARDWSETDGKAVAQHILEHVQPGSIILLHDGLDGTVHADRSVLRGRAAAHHRRAGREGPPPGHARPPARPARVPRALLNRPRRPRAARRADQRTGDRRNCPTMRRATVRPANERPAVTARGFARLGTCAPGGLRVVTRTAAAGMAARSITTSTMRVRDRYTGTGTRMSLRTR